MVKKKVKVKNPAGFLENPAGFFPHILKWGKNPAGFFKKNKYKFLTKKWVSLIVIVAENEYWSLFPNINFPRGVFLPFQIVGEKPRRVFWKFKVSSFWKLSFQKHFWSDKESVYHHCVPLKQKKNPPAGFFPPRGFSPILDSGGKIPQGF